MMIGYSNFKHYPKIFCFLLTHKHFIPLILTPHAGGVCPQKGMTFFLENIQHHMQWERLGMPYGMFLTGRARAEAKEQEKLQSRGGLSTFPNNLEIIRERFQCSFVILKTLNL